MKVCKSVSNCKKLRIFIKSVVERSIIILSKQEYNYVYIEYGEIISASEIVNEYDAIYDVWNVYNIQNISHTENTVNFQISLLLKVIEKIRYLRRLLGSRKILFQKRNVNIM